MTGRRKTNTTVVVEGTYRESTGVQNQRRSVREKTRRDEIKSEKL